MNRMRGILWAGVATVVFAAGAYAQDARPYMGVLLDSNPLSALLAKHLRLDPGQGVLIRNIVVGSPADKAGLDVDDIIIKVQGQDVTSGDMLVEAIADETVGATITLEIIHLGQRKTVELTLEAPGEHRQLKYPSEPEVATTWLPGRVWRMGPGGQGWTQVPFQSIPQINPDMRGLLQGNYTYYGGVWPDFFTITVEGDPNDQDSRVVVRASDGEHVATVGTVEALPEKYRAGAAEALKGAIQAAQLRSRFGGGARMPAPPIPSELYPYFQNPNPSPGSPQPPQPPEDESRTLEHMQEQLERLQQRMDQMEQRYKDPSSQETP